MDEILSSGIVSLRALEPGDIDILYSWENDTSLWKLSNTHVPFSKHLLEQYLKHSAHDIYELKELRLIIQNRELKPVGIIDLFDFDPYHQRAGIGILIHSKEDRQHGYAFDSLMTIEKYALEVLGLKQLYASIPEDNAGSIKLFQKAGFGLTGIKKMWLHSREGWKDEWFFQKILI